jgi:NAD(P)-dependent dehydrogenase (short-subunit alcohol dehydrogenase family)
VTRSGPLPLCWWPFPDPAHASTPHHPPRGKREKREHQSSPRTNPRRAATTAALPMYLLPAFVLQLMHATLCFVLGETNTNSLILRGLLLRRKHQQRLRSLACTLHKGKKLAGRTIMVTGSARGLGSGIAAHLVASGARVVIPLRVGPEDMDALKRRLASSANAVARRYGSGSETRAADVDVVSPTCGLELGSLRSIDRFVESLRKDGVAIDTLINNAGMVPIDTGSTTEGFERAFGINYLGTVHLTQLLEARGVLRAARAGGAGAHRVVNISSEEHRLSSYAEHMPLILEQAGGDDVAGAADAVASLPAAGAAASSVREPIALGTVPQNASMLNAMDRYAYSKLLLTTYSCEASRRSSAIYRDICPGPVASTIASGAPWPIGPIVVFCMKLLFVAAEDAAMPVIDLATTPLEDLPSASAVHYHMSEPYDVGSGADNLTIGRWLWDETQNLLKARSPPGVDGASRVQPRRGASRSPKKQR